MVLLKLLHTVTDNSTEWWIWHSLIECKWKSRKKRTLDLMSLLWVGRVSQHINPVWLFNSKVRIRQHIPRFILSKGRQTSGHFQVTDSDIGEYLLTINSCRTRCEDDCFSVLHRARDKIHLEVLGAIYIAMNRPLLCRQLSSHILNILGKLLETGVTWDFFSPRLLNPIIEFTSRSFNIFRWLSLTSAGRKGPRYFIVLEYFPPLFTNDFIIHLFI